MNSAALRAQLTPRQRKTFDEILNAARSRKFVCILSAQIKQARAKGQRVVLGICGAADEDIAFGKDIPIRSSST